MKSRLFLAGVSAFGIAAAAPALAQDKPFAA